MALRPIFLSCLSGLISVFPASAANTDIQADVLIVGGTESGCAAAVQAARMGVKNVVLVNDIEWLGGQYSAEGLATIDENRSHDYNGTVPFPRSGIYRKIYGDISAQNIAKFSGIAAPGNTRVNLTSLPADSEKVFRQLLLPYEQSGVVKRHSNFYPTSAVMKGDVLSGVVFTSASDSAETITVTAGVTIDASDWGDIVRLSGAAYEFGPDTKAKYGEALAAAEVFPATDMNPITYCMILEEQEEEVPIAKPPGYNERDFSVGKWNYLDAEFAYTSRRLVDNKFYPQITHPDVLLINNPNVDYPLDVLPEHIAAALEATEAGASGKNIAEMTRAQRKIVFDDAKARSLNYLYYLQQVTSTDARNFKKMALTDMFGTADKFPPKPYARESLRLKAQYMTRQGDTDASGDVSNFADVMFHDAVLGFQFEYDFHPTRRSLHTEPSDGSWYADFRGKRGFGNGGSGLATFPLRSMIPETVDGLVTAQKNLGYSSIVGSALRLHDQSVAVGQAAGAAAAVAFLEKRKPRKLPFSSAMMSKVWNGLLLSSDGIPPAVLRPFADIEPLHPAYVAVNQLGVRNLLGGIASGSTFDAGSVPSAQWLVDLVETANRRGYSVSSGLFETAPATRGDAAIALWNALSRQPEPEWVRLEPGDADADGVPDGNDPLPFLAAPNSWTVAESSELPD